MASYVVTGVSSGLGFEIVRQVSANPDNTVIGLVRNKPATEKKVKEELGDRANIHILGISDLTSVEDLKVSRYPATKLPHWDTLTDPIIQRAAAETAAITGGSLDYLIANAGYVTSFDAFDPLDTLAAKPAELREDFIKSMDINVIGNIYLYNAFMPLILKGKVKKVVAISSGMADIELCREYDLYSGAIYACSKAAMNIVTAKYSAQYKDQGVLFLSICPGSADVGKVKPEELTQHQIQEFGTLIGKFQKYQPNFKGPVKPEVAIKAVINTWENASIEKGHGGAFLSHLGSKQWL
ncbi:NAD(P)-binding protein [Xylaria sp. CBS 124048]|nr:NAD(P)-binding protein [Xylaria sp. CBS 124048]